MGAYKGSFTILECVDSTNNYAMQQVHNGNAHHGDCWFAMEQTMGRGRRGKHWLSEKGENILMTVIADADYLKLRQQFMLNVAVALAGFELLNEFGNLNIKIKWPNDIYLNDRKAGGILIENVVKGNIWQWAVIGIGINVNQTIFEEGALLPVSLKQLTGLKHNPVSMGRELLGRLLNKLEELKAGNGAEMLKAYNHVLFKRDETVKLRKQNAVFETRIEGVTAYGQLVTRDNIQRHFDFDEVTWVL